ncbi:MAG: DUF1501 domain-containing protein [Planctomycetota bacterium]
MSGEPPRDGRVLDHRGAPPLTRREMLQRCANGFGAMALTALTGERAYAIGLGRGATPHHAARARNVIFLYMDGGPSQVDTFDPKPRLDREHGTPIKMDVPPTQFDDVGDVLRSPWAFREGGESGIPVSDLFPHVRSCADELAVIRSMHSKFPEHTNANYFLHTGHGQQGRPSLGSWIQYGLGSPSRDLPGFIVLDGGLIPPGGLDNFNSGFLPATFQGSVFRGRGEPVANVAPGESSRGLQRRKLDLLAQLERAGQAHHGSDPAIEAAIENYELAFRMQAAVPELVDLRGESPATRRLYGLEAPYKHTRTYGTLCLLARRLVERGVRFVELTCPDVGADRWDQHSGLQRGHFRNATAVDQPIAALLTDLRSRGLLESTIVVWGGEFGRTPMAQGSDGRDHNPFGFSMWLAGAGVKGGTIHGATDDYGYFAVQDKVEVHDLHATILHLLGVDHERLTYRFGGRDMRLTDVHGDVVRAVLA